MDSEHTDYETEVVRVELVIGFTPNVGYAPFYVALDRGFYQDEGLEVTVRYAAEGVGAAVRQVAAGNAEFAYGGDSAAIDAALAGLPIVAVQTIIPRNLFGIAYYGDSDISGLGDLAGEAVAFSGPAGGDTAVAKIMLQRAGLSFEEIVPLYLGSQTVPAFIEEKVAGLGGYLPQHVLATSLSKRPVVRVGGDEYTALGSTFLYANEQTTKERPGVVARFVAATQRGLVVAVDDPEAGVDAYLRLNQDVVAPRDISLLIWSSMVERGFPDNETGPRLPSADDWQQKLEQLRATGQAAPESVQGHISDDFVAPLLAIPDQG